MASTIFVYPPSPPVLHWLSAGQLANRLQRSIRVWVLLRYLYNPDINWAANLPTTFGYPEIRLRLFAETHPTNEQLKAQALTEQCRDLTCVCHKSLADWVFHPSTQQNEADWQAEILQLTGLPPDELASHIQQCPFATVHRSLREDLKFLANQGWLQALSQGRYRCLPASQWPTPPSPCQPSLSFEQLSVTQTWELLRVLESISFVQPNLDVIVSLLWEKATNALPPTPRFPTEPMQRIFLHLDYILSDTMQETVDAYQEQLEQLWHTPDGGVIQFQYWLAPEERQVSATVYPVCMHYVRRAKYLSAYGEDPQGNMAWHNYRLDRIASDRLTVLAWGDPQVPKTLQEMRHTGRLPTSSVVDQALKSAWGFNFYLPRQLLILRFPQQFARWYVDDTDRHPTFQPIPWKQLPKLIRQEIPNPEEQATVLQIVQQRASRNQGNPSVYYRAWVRVGDINVLMRLREWRPNGEVIAPLSLRQQMAAEAAQELEQYEN